MTGPIEFAPSTLSAGARLGAQFAAAVAAGTRGIHVDVMEGHLMPTLTFCPTRRA